VTSYSQARRNVFSIELYGQETINALEWCQGHAPKTLGETRKRVAAKSDVVSVDFGCFSRGACQRGGNQKKVDQWCLEESNAGTRTDFSLRGLGLPTKAMKGEGGGKKNPSSINSDQQVVKWGNEGKTSWGLVGLNE